MPLSPELKKLVEDEVQEKIQAATEVSGGCIASAMYLKTDQNQYFLKHSKEGLNSFLEEAHGLEELAKQVHISLPKIIIKKEAFLLLEFIETSLPKGDFWKSFGENLAKMHQVEGPQFGFYEDNFIGSTEQINTRMGNWADYFWETKLKFQIHLAKKKGLLLSVGEEALQEKVRKILDQINPIPSLLHGDLWSGNYLCSKDNKPYLIDPAVYYGHHEADIAMTKLFGGFPNEFYSSYEKVFAFEPGHEKRINLYKLYHVINHVNIFGSSYSTQAEDLIASL